MSKSMSTHSERRRERIAVLSLVVAGVGVLGLVEGVRDTVSAGVTHRVAGVLAYAIATWCVPAVLATSAGLLLAALLARRAGPRARAAFGGGVGLGATAAAAVVLDGHGVLLAVTAGLVIATAGAWLLARRPGGVFRCSVGAAGLLVVGWLACSWALRPEESYGRSRQGHGTPVVLIVADALRADALAAYGGARPTPHIDGIGQRGWTVPDAVSTSSWTLPSMASLWTSREPGLHGVRTSAGVLDDELPVLAEQLSEHGYRTAAVISNPILDPARGFARGFDVVRADTHAAEASLFWIGRLNRLALEQGWISGPNASRKLSLPGLGWDGLHVRRSGYAAADEVTDDALDLLDGLGTGSFFLYVHYFDPHDPYLPHPPRLTWHEPHCTPENREVLLEDYAGEVAFLDGQVGRLLHGLEERGILDHALVVFTADHGEEFLDHGNWRHRASLYDELLRLPLLMSFPDAVAPIGPSPRTASLVDVAPTILGTLGLPPLEGARGRDLRTAGDPVVRYADRIEEGRWLASVRRDDQAWIVHLPRGMNPTREQVLSWRAALAVGESATTHAAAGASDAWAVDEWVVPVAVSPQVETEGGSFAISAGEYPQPVVRSVPWRVPRDGLLGSVARIAGDGAPLLLMLEELTADGWSVVPGSRRAALPTAGSWREIRLSAVAVAAGDTLRLALGPGDALPPDARWRVRDARLALDDPLLLLSGEVYDLTGDPAQLDDRFPGPPGAWEETVRLLLDYLSAGREATERPLDDLELERLRAMGYLR